MPEITNLLTVIILKYQTHIPELILLSELYACNRRAEQELDNHKRQLNYEKEDKRDLVNKLKRQLDIHQEHLNKLKTELAASHKHQVGSHFW